MLFHEGSNQHPTSSYGSQSDGENCQPAQPARGLLLRLFLWLWQGLGLDGHYTLPVRVYYKFDSGCWRNRSTRQLHKVYRCR
jgi:hypothetical protein